MISAHEVGCVFQFYARTCSALQQNERKIFTLPLLPEPFCELERVDVEPLEQSKKESRAERKRRGGRVALVFRKGGNMKKYVTAFYNESTGISSNPTT